MTITTTGQMWRRVVFATVVVAGLAACGQAQAQSHSGGNTNAAASATPAAGTTAGGGGAANSSTQSALADTNQQLNAINDELSQAGSGLNSTEGDSSQ